MKRPTALSFLAVLLVGLHLVAALAGFLGPYDPSYQDRDLPWAPPSRLHFFSTEGFHPRPFVHPLVPDPENPPPGCPFHPRCPKAMDICGNTPPNETDIGTEGRPHVVRCHLF